MSFLSDGAHGAKAVQIGRAHAATALTASAVDTLGFSKAVIVASFGALADSATVVLNVATSATEGGSYTDVAGFTYTVVTTADDNTTLIIGEVSLPGVDRWLRAEAAIGGSGNVTIIVDAILTGAKYTPGNAPLISGGPTPAV